MTNAIPETNETASVQMVTLAFRHAWKTAAAGVVVIVFVRRIARTEIAVTILYVASHAEHATMVSSALTVIACAEGQALIAV
jgi:hypothetical protein